MQDNGVGMSETTRSRCLEPFFTTKGERGTGLGLTMVFGMMQRHGGELEIDSELGPRHHLCAWFSRLRPLTRYCAKRHMRRPPRHRCISC